MSVRSREGARARPHPRERPKTVAAAVTRETTQTTQIHPKTRPGWHRRVCAGSPPTSTTTRSSTCCSTSREARSSCCPKTNGLPFDNEYIWQEPSAALIEGVELLASDAAERLLADPGRRDRVVGCTPSGPADVECFRSFVTSFGRRALRRPITAEEEAELMAMHSHAIDHDDFYTGVDSAVRALLQSPSFLYRVERGTPVGDGLFRLDDYELASRLSYFLWGTMPSDALLDKAQAGELGDPDQVRTTAENMLADPRALDRVVRFHELWMGYERLPHDYALASAMKQETRQLMQRVVFDEKSAWQDLLRMDETFVDATLADHYGLAAPADPSGAWVPYAESGRQGLLSHGSFLSVGQANGDTSPTQRGLMIRTRLFCQEVLPPPPDENVNVDEPPGDPNDCKTERYAAHQVAGTSCYGCHNLMDPIGFGLENYDLAGRFRTEEPGKPECEIEGQGELAGVGSFSGPAELADLMIEAGGLNRCVATQLYRYAIGRYELGELDENFLDAVMTTVGDGDFRLDEMLLEFVASDMFRYRREEEV